jgi:hypothetical protein
MTGIRGSGRLRAVCVFTRYGCIMAISEKWHIDIRYSRSYEKEEQSFEQNACLLIAVAVES